MEARVDCPNEDAILAYAERMLPADESDAIAKHLDACGPCRSLVAAAMASSRASALVSPEAPLEVQASGLTPGQKVGRYVVLELVGKGSMGSVYSAYDSELDRKVALKLLRAGAREEAAAGDLKGRFLREARTMAQLSHPNVVAVYDVGTLGNDVFIAMDFVQGQTLRAWLRPGRSWQEIVRVFLEAGRGLAAAHAVGIVHRDFKTDNVLVDRSGRVFVADFGLARGTRESEEPAGMSPVTPSGDAFRATMTATGAILGTPAYMAPEQYEGSATARSDIFAFGISLHEALYGGHPFPLSSLAELREAVQAKRVREPLAGTRVPRFLRTVILRALEPDPAARWPTMTALIAALSVDPEQKRRRALLAVAAVLVFAGGTLAYAAGRESPGAVCTGSLARLASVWGASERAAVERAFAATAVAYREETVRFTTRDLDAYAAAWGEAHRDACEATHVRREQSAELLDRRMQCLDDRLRHFRALVQTFVSADAKTVENAGHAVSRLPRLEGCADKRQLLERVAPPADAETQAKVETVRVDLAAIAAQEHAGHYKEARPRAIEAVARAREIGYRPLLAEALLRAGELARGMDDNKTALAELDEATVVALAARHEDVGIRAQIAVIQPLSLLGHIDDALRASDQTLGRIEGAGGEASVRADALFERTSVLWEVYRLKEVESYLKQAIALTEASGAAESSELPVRLVRLSAIYMNSGRFEDAIRVGEQAAAISEKTLGALHPNTAYCRAQTGVAQLVAHRAARAEETLRRALAIQVQVLGPDHHNTLGTRGNLAVALYVRGHYQEALRESDTVGAIRKNRGEDDLDGFVTRQKRVWILARLGRLDLAGPESAELVGLTAKRWGPDHDLHGEALATAGLVAELSGRFEEALARNREAIPIILKHDDFFELPAPLLAEPRLLRRLGRLPEAIARGEEALKRLEALQGVETEAANAALELGKTYLAAKDVSRARALFERALSRLRERTEDVPLVQLVDAELSLARALPPEESAQARALGREAADQLRRAPPEDPRVAELGKELAKTH